MRKIIKVNALGYLAYDWLWMVKNYEKLLKIDPDDFGRICDPRTVLMPQVEESTQKLRQRIHNHANSKSVWCNLYNSVCVSSYPTMNAVGAFSDVSDALLIDFSIEVDTNAANRWLKTMRSQFRVGWPFVATMIQTDALREIYNYLRYLKLVQTEKAEEYYNDTDAQVFESTIAWSAARSAAWELLKIDNIAAEDVSQWTNAFDYASNVQLAGAAAWRKDSVAAAIARKRHDELFSLVKEDGNSEFKSTGIDTIYKFVYKTV